MFVVRKVILFGKNIYTSIDFCGFTAKGLIVHGG